MKTRASGFFCVFAAMYLASTSVHASEGLGDIWRDSRGGVVETHFDGAEDYCKERGGLPTARQFALHSQSLGAKGLRETAYQGVLFSDAKVQAEMDKMEADKYFPIYTNNKAGEIVVDFYFNHEGYQRPKDDSGYVNFWSSSVHPYYVYPRFGHAIYYFSGYYGDLPWVFTPVYFAVRCARSGNVALESMDN